MIEGDLPKKAQELVKEWMNQNQKDLLDVEQQIVVTSLRLLGSNKAPKLFSDAVMGDFLKLVFVCQEKKQLPL